MAIGFMGLYVIGVLVRWSKVDTLLNSISESLQINRTKTNWFVKGSFFIPFTIGKEKIMLVFKLDLIAISKCEHDGCTEIEQLLYFNNAVYILSRSVSKKMKKSQLVTAH